MSGEKPSARASRIDEPSVPAEVDSLLDYVASLDVEVVLVEWNDEGRHRTTFAVEVTPVPGSVPASDDATVDVRSVDGDQPVALAVPVARIRTVRSVSDAETAMRSLPTEPAARATTLRGLGEHVPSLVPVASVLPLLEHDPVDEGQLLRDALACLTHVAREHPGDCVAAVPAVVPLLSAPAGVRAEALAFLVALAETRPSDVTPHLGVVRDALVASESAVVAAAVRCVAHLASHEPTAIVGHEDRLVELLEADDGELRMHAAYALGRVAVVSPETVRPHVTRLTTVVGDRSARIPTRLNATCAVGRVAGEWPDAVVDHLGAFVETLAGADARLRANAAGVVGDVAVTHAVDVRHHLGALVERLDDEDGTVRVNASTAIARVAREFPDAVGDHVGRLVGALDDEEEVVRENACWTLGSLRERARTARPALERVHADDGDEQVRDRARWALGELPLDGTGLGD